MKVTRGVIKNGGIVFAEPLGLPEGTAVAVTIEPMAETNEPGAGSDETDFALLPFFGIWAGREEMQDSAAWVEQTRARWQQRAAGRD